MTAPLALLIRDESGALAGDTPLPCHPCDARCEAYPCINADPDGSEIIDAAGEAAKE